jgi:hypothetical protein
VVASACVWAVVLADLSGEARNAATTVPTFELATRNATKLREVIGRSQL